MKEEKKVYNPEVTKEDKNILGDKSGNIHNDEGDDSILLNREKPVDFTGKNLDVPGRQLPSERTPKELKDEENQLYSFGTEDNENLESTEELE